MFCLLDPRRRQKRRLVHAVLVRRRGTLLSLLCGKVAIRLATIGVFAQHYMSQGISFTELANWSQCGTDWSPEGGAALCSALFRESGRVLPQTMALTTLVCMEMIKALSAVSVDNLIFRVGPQSNKWLLLGVYSSKLGLPGLGESFGMVRHTNLHLFLYFPNDPLNLCFYRFR